jgi:hypothetical protein
MYQSKYRNSDEATIKRRLYMNKYVKERNLSDKCFKLKSLLRRRLLHAVHKTVKAGSSIDDLGCSVEELKTHLEKQFQDGMTWENHGRIDRKNPKIWNIDHKVPLDSFDLTNREQFLQAVHYTNLQPLWAHDNISKGNR